jgi:hypothetical protein
MAVTFHGLSIEYNEKSFAHFRSSGESALLPSGVQLQLSRLLEEWQQAGCIDPRRVGL